MKKLIWLFIIVPFVTVLTALAVANRHEVNLILDPFYSKDPAIVVSMPFFIFIISSMILGVFLGGFGTWLNQGRWRKTARERALEAHQWRLRAEKLNKQLQSEEQNTVPALSMKKVS